MITYDIEGIAFANQQLRQLDQRIRKSVVRKAVRAGGNVIRDAVRQEAPKRTGALRAAMRLTIKSDRKTGSETGTVKINKKTRRKRRGRRIIPSKYMHLVTGGVKRHEITPKRKRAMAFGEDEAYSRVQHPGTRANDYMDRAYNRSNTAGLATFTREYKRLTNEEINKQASEARAKQ